jgi:hypothetical protein
MRYTQNVSTALRDLVFVFLSSEAKPSMFVSAVQTYATFQMQFSNLILFASLLVATGTAFGGDPDAGIPILGTVIESDHVYIWEKKRISATETAESGTALRALNYLQDQLGRPRVDEVWYDFDSDFYHWRGPATGNRMAMTRMKFEREILNPYYEVKTDEQK